MKLVVLHSDENLDFWMEAEKYRKASAQEVKPIANYILQNFIESGSVQEINIDSTIHHQAVDGLAKNPPISDCLIHAQEHVFKLMKMSAYPRFINSLPK